mmetsp:Transcript_20582/g.51516  ORF Transcript_20582/g.51516 Transcript_20582/m.51516 type:complete len:255 (-) Transcript_20582:163-927(-)
MEPASTRVLCATSSAKLIKPNTAVTPLHRSINALDTSLDLAAFLTALVLLSLFLRSERDRTVVISSSSSALGMERTEKPDLLNFGRLSSSSCSGRSCIGTLNLPSVAFSMCRWTCLHSHCTEASRTPHRSLTTSICFSTPCSSSTLACSVLRRDRNSSHRRLVPAASSVSRKHLLYHGTRGFPLDMRHVRAIRTLASVCSLRQFLCLSSITIEASSSGVKGTAWQKQDVMMATMLRPMPTVMTVTKRPACVRAK